MKKLSKLNYIIIFCVAVVLEIVIDQVTKVYTFESGKFSYNTETPFIGKFFSILLMENTGSSFGLFQNANIPFFIITLIGLPVFVFMSLRARTRSVVGQIGFNLCVGGTIGNAIDRAYFHTAGEFFGGNVRDFLVYYLPYRADGEWKWRFLFCGNVADIFLVVGVILAILAIVFFDYDSLFASEKAVDANEKD